MKVINGICLLEEMHQRYMIVLGFLEVACQRFSISITNGFFKWYCQLGN